MAITFDRIIIEDNKRLITIKNQDGEEEILSVSGPAYSVLKCLCEKNGEGGANAGDIYLSVFPGSTLENMNSDQSFQTWKTSIINRLNKVFSKSDYGTIYRITTDRATKKTQIHIRSEHEMDSSYRETICSKIKEMATIVDKIESQSNESKVEKLFHHLMEMMNKFIKKITNKGRDNK